MSMFVKEKHCTGHKGVWACEEDYPDRILPIEEFQKNQSMCKRCSRMRLSKENPKNNPIRSISYGIAGGFDKYYSLPKEDRISIRAEAKLAHLLTTAPAEEVLPFIQSRKSEFGQSVPMTKRTITKVEGERVPEGWVYIVRNPDVPSIVKIGKTFPDGIPDIMSSARRFGRAELVAKYEFKEAYKAEQSIHKRLERHNLRALGYKDCGKELFQCDEMVAVFAILAEGPVLDETEDVA